MGAGHAASAAKFGACAALASALALVLPGGAGAATLKTGDILVAEDNAFAGHSGGVVRVDPATGAESVLSSNELAVNASSQLFDSPFHMVLTPHGKLLIADYGASGDGSGAVIAVDPATGRETLVSDNAQAANASNPLFESPTGIVRLPSGRLVIVDNQAFGDGLGGLIAVDPATGKQSTFSSNVQAQNATSGLYNWPYNAVLDGRGGLLVADSGNPQPGKVIGVGANGKQRLVSSNDQAVNATSGFFEEPSDIVRTPGGQLYLTDDIGGPAGLVIGVNPRTGKQRIVSSNSQPVNASSQLLNAPYGIAIDLSGQLVIGDEDAFTPNGGILGVSPITGKQRGISWEDQPVNAGGEKLIDTPNGVLVVPPRCAGLYPTIVGSQKRDKLRGTRFPDVILGLGGNDVIRGLGAKDRLCGGRGRDRLFGGKGHDELRGGPGPDRQRQ